MADGSATTHSERRTVLVADDCGVSRTLLAASLRATCDVVLVCDAPDVMNLLAAGDTFDCIVLDDQMPNGTGLDIAAEIKRRPGLEHIPVILVTATATTERQVLGMRAGVAAFINKPIDGRQLARIVDMVAPVSKRRVIAH